MQEKCPHCKSKNTEFIDSNNFGDGEIHFCLNCDKEFDFIYCEPVTVPDSPNDYIDMGDY